MHELGVVFHIADSLAKIAEENHVARISRVTLQLGEVSTVVPEYLTDVWNWNCKRTPLLTGCALEIERIPAVTHCGACGQDYPTVPQGKRCPRCGSEDTWLIQGFFINGGEVLVGEAVVLYLLGVPLLLFFRRSGLMEKLLRGTPHARG